MEKPAIQCERCGKHFKKLDNLRRHFERINVCRPILAAIPVAELKQKFCTQKGVYKCENCGKVYKTRAGKCKHKKTCEIIHQKNSIIAEQNKIIDSKDSMLQDALLLVQREKELREQLETQVRQMLVFQSQTQTQSHNQTSHTTNHSHHTHTYTQHVQHITNNNIIIVNNFGEERLDHLFQDALFLQKCLESPLNSVANYLDYVHFNHELPENQNIKLTNLQSPFMDYFKNGNWNKIEQKVLIPRIITNSINAIHEIITNQSGTADTTDPEKDPKIEKWYQYKSQVMDKNNAKHTAVRSKLKTKTKRVIYNKSIQN